MKTNKSTKLQEGKGIVFLLTVLLWMAGTMSVQATDYDLWVGGKRVTSGNANNITYSTIDGATGSVTYDATNKILKLKDVSIDCSDNYSNNQGIYNKGIEGLRIYCYGQTSIYSEDNAGLQCDVETKVFIQDGTTWIESDNSRAVYINKTLCSLFCLAKLYITGYQCPAIEGVSSSSGQVLFYGKNIDVEGKRGDLVNLYSASFQGQYRYSSTTTWTHGCDVTLEKTGNSNYPCVKNVGNFYGTKSNITPQEQEIHYAIVTYPASADFNSSKKSVCDAYGNPIYTSDIDVNENYAAVVNDKYFPDTNFRNYLKNSFGTFISPSQMNNTTTLNLINKNIADLTGIKYFTELKVLQLYNNRLTQLDLSNNTKLTRLECVSNQLTQLNLNRNSNLTQLECDDNRLSILNLGSNSQLTWVTCDNNQLTSLNVPCSNLQGLSCNGNNLTHCLFINNTYSNLKEIYCADNPNLTSMGVDIGYLPALEKFDCSGTGFSSLSLSVCTKLKELTCENMNALKSLSCNLSSLTTVKLSGCSKLESLNCSNNELTTLDVYGCSSLHTLVCQGNQLTSIAHLNSCQSALQELNIIGNKFTRLDLSDFGSLKSLRCSSNQLTTLNLLGVSNLETLNCSNNPLTSLDLTASTFPNLREVNCSYCNLTSIAWDNLRLTTLDCSYNSNLTALFNYRDVGNTVRPLSSLNVKGCTKLKFLDVNNNQLTTIDLSSCSQLSLLNCGLNQLTTLNVEVCTDLSRLLCQKNQLTTLDLSNNRKLYFLECSGNKLYSLNVRDFTYLQILDCEDNQLTSLDLRGCNALELLTCYNNNISSLILPQENTTLNIIKCYGNLLDGTFMDVLIGSLPDRKELSQGNLYLIYEVYGDNNVCTWQNVKDAKSKNWIVLSYNWNWEWAPYSGSGVPTTISTAETDNDGDAPRYNMSGQRVGRDYKGVVIVNGKKKVVK